MVRGGAGRRRRTLRALPLTVISCHWLPFLRDSHSNVAIIAVISYQNGRCGAGRRRRRTSSSASATAAGLRASSRSGQGSAKARCVWSYLHHPLGKDWCFTFKRSKIGTKNSKRIVISLARGRARARPHRRFKNRGTKFVSEYGSSRLSQSSVALPLQK